MDELYKCIVCLLVFTYGYTSMYSSGICQLSSVLSIETRVIEDDSSTLENTGNFGGGLFAGYGHPQGIRVGLYANLFDIRIGAGYGYAAVMLLAPFAMIDKSTVYSLFIEYPKCIYKSIGIGACFSELYRLQSTYRYAGIYVQSTIPFRKLHSLSLSAGIGYRFERYLNGIKFDNFPVEYQFLFDVKFNFNLLGVQL